jgi:hypothetical protein
VAVRVVSTAATASATGPPVGPMVGASAIATAAARVAVRDDLTIAASSCSAVATLRGSTAFARVRLGLAGSSARVRLQLRSALRLVALLSRFLAGGGWVTLLSTRMK